MLFAIGGALDCTGEQEILKRLLQEAQGVQSRVLLITSATGYPDDARKTYTDTFTGLGVAACTVAHPVTPDAADDPALLAALADADIVFFTGGDQLRLSQALQGSRFLELLRDRQAEGCIVAGTSAGAAAIAHDMIYEEQAQTCLKQGFGLRTDLIVDTHFSERNRLGRLFAMAAQGGRVGLGVDENTAVILKNDGTLEVVGAGTATIVNDNKAAALRAGDCYDLKRGIKL